MRIYVLEIFIFGNSDPDSVDYWRERLNEYIDQKQDMFGYYYASSENIEQFRKKVAEFEVINCCVDFKIKIINFIDVKAPKKQNKQKVAK